MNEAMHVTKSDPPRYEKTESLLKAALGRYGPVQQQAKLDSAEIQLTSGERVQAFAKSSTGKTGDSVRMWEDVVEPGLRSGLLVQARHASLCLWLSVEYS